MTYKLLVFSLAIVMLLSIGLMADLIDGRENQSLSLSSPKIGSPSTPSLDKGAAQAVVWDNGMAYVGLLTAQQETLPAGLDSEPADDFIFDVDQVVNDVHWIGGYWNGPPDDGDFDWTIRFYADDGTGTAPGALLATYPFANADVNETWLAGNPGAANFYSYSVVLPTPGITFAAGQKYWISIQSQGNTSPQGGWAYHEEPDILLHEAVIRSVYFGIPDWTNTSTALGVAVDMCFQLTYEEQCSWQPGDPYKMHYPQLPDEAGWDVNATYNPGGLPMVLADDFMCMQTGPILDVHFWGSWKNGIEGQIISFFLSIHEDIPADPPSIPYSRPGQTLWEREVTDFVPTPRDPPTAEGWYDPATGEIIYDDHQAYFQYDICFDPADPDLFVQDSGTIYWLNISAIVADPSSSTWGWKSTQDHWNDDAVWAFWGDLNWIDIWEPAPPQANDFGITIDPTGGFIGGFGGGAFGEPEPWFFYPDTDWWNVWFYDHPFDSTRRKIGRIEFDLVPVDVQAPRYIELAVNWSTDQWSFDQPPADSSPPLPGEDEALYIGREILFASDTYTGDHYTVTYEIPWYNPEWVSVDVRGFNFDIPFGIIEHTCQGSLDLAFVITGGEPPPPDSGACCYDPTGGGINADCVYTTQTECEQILGGVYQGTGVPCTAPEACCLPDGACIMADPLCCVNELGGTPQGAGSQCTQVEACCFTDGSCGMFDPLCCDDLGGTPQGPGTQCTQAEACCFPDGSCGMFDPLCCDDLGGTPQGAGSQCTAPQACCFTDGSCSMVDPLCCDDLGGTVSPYSATCLGDGDGNGTDDACEAATGACCFSDGSCQQLTASDCNQQGGIQYLGDGTKCLGDVNGNGTDDACDPPWQPGDPFKMHYPQLPDVEGWDVWDGTVLADDWRCIESGPVTDIHFWGSWLDGIEGTILAFEFRIYSDISASQSPTGYSVPGDMLWGYTTENFNPIRFDGPPEGWYDPISQVYEPGNHDTYFQYDIYIPEGQAFVQDQDTIYWLAIIPIIEDVPPGGRWGWKSSLDHFNDDAVWGLHPLPGPPDEWIELYEPPEFQISLDLAFVITGGIVCDCTPGDANGDGTWNVGDATYVINYVFKGGPPPTPYRICSGDPNCDCAVNVADAVYMINYIFKGGPPPCSCQDWLNACGPPLRK